MQSFKPQKKARTTPRSPERGITRILSKLGICSRAEAERRVLAGRVSVNGKKVLDIKQQVPMGAALQIDGQDVLSIAKIYLALNKPRGLVCTASDEKNRATVFDCFAGSDFPHLSAVGRLDQASEGLLLFTNDTAWASALTDPKSHVDKVYHVQINTVADNALLHKLAAGMSCEGELLRVKKAQHLRHGNSNSWLELTIDQGKNRQLRRILEACEIEVLRLIRVSIGGLVLGTLTKGAWRHLSEEEVRTLGAGKERLGRTKD